MGVTTIQTSGQPTDSAAGHLSSYRSGWVEPTWFRDPQVSTCRNESLQAHREYLELVPSGHLPRRPTIDQLAARRRVIAADAAYEEAKVAALRSCAS